MTDTLGVGARHQLLLLDADPCREVMGRVWLADDNIRRHNALSKAMREV
jgi:hypothetical protein